MVNLLSKLFVNFVQYQNINNAIEKIVHFIEHLNTKFSSGVSGICSDSVNEKEECLLFCCIFLRVIFVEGDE